MQDAQCVGGSRRGSALSRSPASSWWAAPKAATRPPTTARWRARPSGSPVASPASEADVLQQSFDSFTEDTGIIVEYTGDKGFEGNIVTKVAGGDAPDIAIVPQPGLLKALVGHGRGQAGARGGRGERRRELVAGLEGLRHGRRRLLRGAVDGQRQGLCLVLARVVRGVGRRGADDVGRAAHAHPDDPGRRRASRRGAPASSPSAASGWPGTDWIEGLVLRQSGPEVYDQWVANEVKFTDPEIEEAFNAVGEILRNPEYVNAGFGDVASINSTAFAQRGCSRLRMARAR